MDAFATILSYIAPAAEDRQPAADVPVNAEDNGPPGSSAGCTIA
jgi:hypothetical protein